MFCFHHCYNLFCFLAIPPPLFHVPLSYFSPRRESLSSLLFALCVLPIFLLAASPAYLSLFASRVQYSYVKLRLARNLFTLTFVLRNSSRFTFFAPRHDSCLAHLVSHRVSPMFLLPASRAHPSRVASRTQAVHSKSRLVVLVAPRVSLSSSCH